jgi:hypothetical protein
VVVGRIGSCFAGAESAHRTKKSKSSIRGVGGRGSKHCGFEGPVEVDSVLDSTLLPFSFFLSLDSLRI